MNSLRPMIALAAILALPIGTTWAQEPERPNILVIWSDDIGQTNVSAHTFGLVGYETPNIDRIAEGGMMFTDYYGFGGCNNFTGRYTLDGTALSLGSLARTKKACPPAIMDQETKFHAALGETHGYRFDNGLLFLLDAQGAQVMRLWSRD